MPQIRAPRCGSMQFWPRKRAKRPIARVRNWTSLKDAKLLGFAGYKVGMTHIQVIDNKKTSKTKGEKINMPVTILECPPIKVASIRLYKIVDNTNKVVSEIMGATDKELSRKIKTTKNPKAVEANLDDFDEVRVNVYTQPKLTGIGKKKPEYFEVSLGGSKEDALNYAKDILGKEITIKDTFEAGQFTDVHAITTGKGFQGPVKRFGVSIRNHKSEKVIRGPGSIAGGWKAQGHMMYRVAHAGKMGFHQRTEYNKMIVSMGDNPEDVNPKGGFPGYGIVKSNYILMKGSIAGPSKRLIRLNMPIRKTAKVEAQSVTYISIESKQGR